MGSIIIMLMMFCGVPFLLIQCAPGKKSFAVITVAYLLFLAYGYHDINAPHEHDGPGYALGAVFFYMILYGAIAGILTKAVTLFMASKNIPILKRNLVRVLGFALIPCAMYAPSLLHHWQMRAPTTTCNYQQPLFSIAGETFHVPGVEFLLASTGDGQFSHQKKSDIYVFGSPEHQRRFCSDFNNDIMPAPVNSINLIMSNLPRHAKDPKFIAQCEQAHWPDVICHYQGYDVPPNYPENLGIYDQSKFNAGFMGGGYPYARIQEEMKAATQPSDISGFAFDGYNYYWIDTDIKAANPLALKCYKSGTQLYCIADEPWKNAAYVTYAGKVSLEHPIDDARQLRTNSLALIKLMAKR